MRRLIIVDPILRGSRLHYTLLAAKNFSNKYKIIVVGREDIGLPEKNNEKVAYKGIFRLPKEFWYGRVGFINFLLLAKFLLSLRGTKQDRIYFVGLNEWMPWFIVLTFIFWVKKLKVIAIDYEGKYWGQVSGGLRHMLGKLSRYLFFFKDSLKIGVLDERVKICAGNKVFFIPDPPVIGETTSPKKDELVFIKKTTFLAFGVQSERKGVRLIEKLISEHADELVENDIFIKCIGKLSEDTLDMDRSLRNLSGSTCFEWIDEYISDELLVKEILNSDFILLPYHPKFEGSSGVLVHACLWGRPVLTTAHGVVGYRVKKYSLGKVFHYEVASLLSKLIRLDRDYIKSNEYIRGRAEFLSSFSEESHVKALVQQFSKW